MNDPLPDLPPLGGADDPHAFPFSEAVAEDIAQHRAALAGLLESGSKITEMLRVSAPTTCRTYIWDLISFAEL